MNVLPTSRERFIEAYNQARLSNSRIPRLKDSDGYTFQYPMYLLSLNGEAGCIVSEQTGEIASLFGTYKGQGAAVIKAAIAFGGTWLYLWAQLHRLEEHYKKFGFETWRSFPCWDDTERQCTTYMSLKGYRSNIRVKLEDGTCEPAVR